MANMIYDRPRRGTAGLFVLRMAVAGVLAWAGWRQFQPDHRSGLTDLPMTDAAVVPAVTPQTDPTLPPTSPEQVVPAPRAAVGQDGVKVNLGWDAVVGAGEIGVGAVLLLGLLVRVVSLLGTAAVAGGALAAHSLVDLPGWADPLMQAYQANPAAALLLGAIFLALLVGGSGPVAADRVLERRRLVRKESTPVTVTTA
jgi:uncharacterized membrane protein YphA (DoxX/SURF4 family)